MESKNEHTYFVRNVEDGQTVSLSGDGEFYIGLTQDESIASSSKSPTASASHQDGDIVVPLVIVTVWKTSGVTVSPASRDLKCHLNGVDIGSEANIIPGNQLEVGDKVLELLDGTMVKPQRRHLPPTPGVPILPVPPPKPQRAVDGARTATPDTVNESHLKSRDALREWCLGQLPLSESELQQKAKDPDQLANLAASYLTRHINLHTDVVMSTELTDRIFKMMQEVAQHRKDILRNFLTKVLKEVMDDNSQNEGVHHGTVTSLLVEILRQFLDPGYLVLLCLQLLRALSHIPGNVITMVTSHTTAAVLGSMAVYKENERVQSNCLDILAKMATYTPAVLEKPPMRESTIDLVAMAMTLHSTNLIIIQAGIRTLANLASLLHSLAFTSMKESPCPELRAYVSLLITVLEYMYSNTLKRVRDALGIFCGDLTIKTDGRRFLFEYGKMEQLKSQQKLWEQAPDKIPRKINGAVKKQNSAKTEDNVDSGNENDNEGEDATNFSDDNGNSSGILKRSRSFENLRNPERRVSFIEEHDLASFSDGSTSSLSSDGDPPTKSTGVESPDIQILSRSVIYPAHLSTSDSIDGESPGPDLHHNDIENKGPSSTPVKPLRRPIGPPLVHINSQSDSDADSFMDSPSDDGKRSDIVHSKSDSNVYKDNSAHHDSRSQSLPHNGVTSALPSIPSARTPVDLTDFRYTTVDIKFVKRAISVQVTCHVCSVSVQDHNPKALKLIDLSLKELLSQPGVPNALWQFANSQLEEGTTLMDIDPATVISVIDAVRYKMLALDLVRKSLTLLLQSLSPKLNIKMFAITGEIFQYIVRDTALSPIVSDKEFISNIDEELDKVKKSCEAHAPVVRLLENISLVLKPKPKQIN